MEAYLDFSLMPERNQTHNINLHTIEKDHIDNSLRENWKETGELAVESHGPDFSTQYLIGKSDASVQYTTTDSFLLLPGRQENDDSPGINSTVVKTEVGNDSEQNDNMKSLQEGETFPNVKSSDFTRHQEAMSNNQMNYTTWNYSDEIVVLNLSRGEKTSNSTDSIVDQFESDLQSHVNKMHRIEDGCPFENKDQDKRNDIKPLVSQFTTAIDESGQSKGGNSGFPVDEMVMHHIPDLKRGSNPKQFIDINSFSDEDGVAVKCKTDSNIHISRKRKSDLNINPMTEVDLSLKSGQNFQVKSLVKAKSPIKMTFKKRKIIEGAHERDKLIETIEDSDIQEVKYHQDKIIEASTSNIDSDCGTVHGDFSEENVPLDYSMHATLVRQNLSNIGVVHKTTTKHLGDTDATSSDQDQESFCSSLKLVSVNEMEQKKSSSSQTKSGTDSSTDEDESDANEEETDPKDIGQVDKFVFDSLMKTCQEKNKSKAKTAENNKSKGKTFSCDTCSKTFTRKSTWRHHVKIHVDDKFKECKICGKKLKFSGNMLSHLKTHTGDRPFKCDFCEKTFTRAASLYTHVRSHTGEKAFLCEICGKGFSDKSHYRRHLRIHSGIKPFKCEVCEMAFTQSWSLKSHMLSHAEVKPHICSICGKGYTQKAYLESHFRSHTGERPYSCETCGKSFSDSSCMRRHVKSHHGERPFICELCGKAFGRGWNLTVHMRIHYDDKRFECYICGKAFVQKINLDKHILTHPVEPCD